MTTYTGKEGAIDAGGNAVGEIRNFTVDTSADTLDDTVMGDDWKTHKVMHKSFNGSMRVLYDPADAGQGAFSIGTSVAGIWYPSGNSSGNGQLAGNCSITERSIASSYDGLVELDLTFEGNGALTETAVA